MSTIYRRVTNLARKTSTKLINQIRYHSTPSKTHECLSIIHRLNLNHDDSNLVWCVFNGNLHHARQLLDEMPLRGIDSKVFKWTSLLSKLAKEGLVDEAKALFDVLPERNVVTCNAMLGGYVQGGRMVEACEFFEWMEEKNVVSWTSMLRGLMRVGRIEEAKALFGDMPVTNVVSWNTMVGGLIKNGDLEGARTVFDAMSERDLVSWNTMIGGYAKNCMMEEAKALFDRMAERDVVTWTTLFDGYCRVGDVWSAFKIFRGMPVKNVVSWTAMISGFCWNGYYEEAISLFLEMRCQSDVKPNIETFISLAYACAGIGSRDLGMQLHAHSIINCLGDCDQDERLSHGLICMYARCGLMEYAESLFLKDLAIQTTQCCNNMINGYVQKGQMEKAKHIFNIMPSRDKISWTSVITGYFNVNQVAEACKLFNYMPEIERDAIAWTAMISGYVQNELFSEALCMFLKMQMQGLMPLRATYATLLGAAGAAADINGGRQLHSLLIKTHTDVDLILGNSLISVYSKCGLIHDAFRIFSNVTYKDLISWNSMIMGFSNHGLANDCLSLFEHMMNSRVTPNSVTFLGILSACSHTGLIDEGWTIYRSMTDVYGITPGAEHNICMINLLGRAGEIEKAEQFVLNSPFKQDAATLGALLGVCGFNEGSAEIAERTSQRLLELDPVNAAGHIVLCNMNASVGRYGDEGMLRKEMRAKGVRKVPGCSWVSSGNDTCVFLSGDVTQVQIPS